LKHTNKKASIRLKNYSNNSGKCGICNFENEQSVNYCSNCGNSLQSTKDFSFKIFLENLVKSKFNIFYLIFLIIFVTNFLWELIKGHTIDFSFGYSIGFTRPMVPFLLLTLFEKIRSSSICATIFNFGAILFLLMMLLSKLVF
jgi:hypothetical protein